MSDRFWSKVAVPIGTSCWDWTAATRGGYGRYSVGGRLREAHRVAYEELRGPIPDGLVLDHLCRNRPCVNPDHLEVVTRNENSRRQHTGRCDVGHALSGANLRNRRDGTRECLTCYRARQRDYMREARARGWWK